MNTTFQEFIQMCVRKLRGEDDEEELVVDYVCTYRRALGGYGSTPNSSLTNATFHQVEKNINNMTIRMPHQLFIDGEFVDADGGKTYKTINPTDGTVGNRLSLSPASEELLRCFCLSDMTCSDVSVRPADHLRRVSGSDM